MLRESEHTPAGRLLYESSVVLLDRGSIVSVTPLSAIGPAAAAWSKLLAVSPEPAAKT